MMGVGWGQRRAKRQSTRRPTWHGGGGRGSLAESPITRRAYLARGGGEGEGLWQRVQSHVPGTGGGGSLAESPITRTQHGGGGEGLWQRVQSHVPGTGGGVWQSVQSHVPGTGGGGVSGRESNHTYPARGGGGGSNHR